MLGKDIYSIPDLLAYTPPKQTEIISNGILPIHSNLFIFGSAKAWKSMLAQELAFIISRGGKWLDFRTTKSFVFLYQAELPLIPYWKRTVKYVRNLNGQTPDYPILVKIADRVKIDTAFGAAQYEKDVRAVKAIAGDLPLVVILDPMYKLMMGHLNEDYEVRKFQDNLEDVGRKFGLTTIIIHHSHKARFDNTGSPIDTGAEEMDGSFVSPAWCDGAIRLRLLNPNKGDDEVELSFNIMRHAETSLPRYKLKWNRSNLRSEIIKREEVEKEDISIRTVDSEE